MIRPYEDRDLEQLLEVFVSASHAGHPFVDEAFIQAERGRIAEVYLPVTDTWVYELEGEVVGFLALLGSEVGALFVAAEHHGRGFGHALMDKARELHGSLTLDVFEQNSLGRAFYERQGFRQIDRHLHEETGLMHVRMQLDAQRGGEAEYETDQRETLAEAPGLRVRLLALGPGQSVPWHLHTGITDTFFCMNGPMQVKTRSPDATHVLTAGKTLAVGPGTPHEVSPLGGSSCRFMIVQGVGTYDYVPVE
jgi:putative acetyltransferase